MHPHVHLESLGLGLVAAYVALVIHEAGHLLAGKLVGFRFGLLGVGPVALSRTDGALSLRGLSPSSWGPFAVAYPTSLERLPARLACYTAGGPLGSLAGAGLAALGARGFGGAAGHACAWLALISAALFLGTIQPFGTGIGLPSDGARLWGLLHENDASRAVAALVALETLDAIGVRPRDWDPGLVALAAGVERPPAYALAAATTLLRLALDDHDAAAARIQAERIRAVSPRVSRALRADAAAEAAFWFSWFGQDAATARSFLGDARGALGTPHRRWRAEAAALARSGDPVAARKALERARNALDRGIVRASALDRELLEAVREGLPAAS